jgi:hypothetical protein
MFKVVVYDRCRFVFILRPTEEIIEGIHARYLQPYNYVLLTISESYSCGHVFNL